eukprot:SAG31_NODE_15259_length_763_cov_1.280120_1_plen_125_part_00
MLPPQKTILLLMALAQGCCEVCICPAAAVAVLHSRCSQLGSCSRQLQRMLSECADSTAGSEAGTQAHKCSIKLSPPGSTFKLEQARALSAQQVHGLQFDGSGARIVLRGDVPFLLLRDSTGVTL